MHKQAAAAATMTAPLQVVGHGLPHVDRERQQRVAVALARDADLAGAPVDVIDTERGDLPGAQPQPRQHDQDRVVAAAVRRSQLASSRATWPAASARGIPPPRQPGAVGAAAASDVAVCPCTYKKRSGARSAVTTLLTDPTLRRPHSAATKAATSPAVSSPRSTPSAGERPSSNRAATLR